MKAQLYFMILQNWSTCTAIKEKKLTLRNPESHFQCQSTR